MPENSWNDPISYTMTVFGLLNPFLAILDFFDSYHALVTLCKLKNLEKVAFLTTFAQNWRFWPSQNLAEKWLKIEQYWSKNRFFGLFDNFSPFPANPEKKNFFSIFCEFFRAHIRFFGIFFGKKIAARCENRENTYLGPKKFAKNRKKKSGLARNA